ncbi:MAG: BCAM0308 family protein [Dehalococcoidia bacterium]
MPSPANPQQNPKQIRTSGARHDTAIKDATWDAYRGPLPPEPTRCPGCGATVHGGRWTWEKAPAGAHEQTCPACRRIADDYPEGFLTISGSFFAAHRQEILALIENVATTEGAEHPLNRVMDQREEGGSLIIRTTDNHLPRRMGEALHGAYKGTLDFRYPPEEAALRVTWSRDATGEGGAGRAPARH